jgi:hypothetical protein
MKLVMSSTIALSLLIVTPCYSMDRGQILSCVEYQNTKQPTEQHSFIDNSLIGALSGVCEVTINQPAIAIKNELQTRIKAPKTEHAATFAKKNVGATLSKLYKGYGVNVASMAPITAIQVGVYGVLTDYFARKGNLSDREKTAAAFLAGTASALASSPADMLVIQQGQVTKDTFLNTLKAIIGNEKANPFAVLSKLYRGVLPTAIRDGGFTVGYLALGDIIKKSFAIDTGNKLTDTALSGIPAGLIAGVITHPFDRISTSLKKDLAKESYRNSFQTALKIAQEEGIAGLFKGLIPRATRIAIAIPVLSYVKELLEKR